MRKGRSQMAPCRWRRHRAGATAGVVPFHAELCRAHWGFCSCFSRHGSFLVMQRGKLPSADLHKGVGGPLPPPHHARAHLVMPRWVMGGLGLGCPPTKPLVDARTGQGYPWTKAHLPPPPGGESPFILSPVGGGTVLRCA